MSKLIFGEISIQNEEEKDNVEEELPNQNAVDDLYEAIMDAVHLKIKSRDKKRKIEDLEEGDNDSKDDSPGDENEMKCTVCNIFIKDIKEI
ncbi:hypothetical protein Glove_195g3 [Diversispora epigaea]|uniref:Uncharacterized protein n=1 Tax=Diversispora epigaea TaxID=1348612 RepID=A0A397IL16_9GLOM|nr:hypothetical protein Glove_195g3 [Diversispora epigaea]